jgi:hypothetical protein
VVERRRVYNLGANVRYTSLVGALPKLIGLPEDF